MPAIRVTFPDGRVETSDGRTLAEAREENVRRVKAEALDRIRALFGCAEDQLVWREMNLVSRAAELLGAWQSRAPTAPELAEWQAGQATWDAVKAIRAASDAAETRIRAAATNAAADAVSW